MSRAPSIPLHSTIMGSRPSRRSLQHDSATGGKCIADSPIPEHELVPRSETLIVNTPEALADLVGIVRAHGGFAFDTEFIGEETYIPKLCLIQIATPAVIALVDPLAGLDLMPVWDLVTDRNIETVVHAGQQDLEPIVRLSGKTPESIYDTQIAAAFTDRSYPISLSNLVEACLGIQLEKAYTFTQWDKRPLTHAHCRYAADDVRYLHAIRQWLGHQVETRGHAARVAEECAAFSERERYHFHPETRLPKLIGNRTMNATQVTTLLNLLTLRESIAKRENIPPRALARDDHLVRMAREGFRKLNQLRGLKGFSGAVVDAVGEELLAAIATARELPPTELHLAMSGREDPLQKVCIDGMWAVSCALCLGQSIDPSIVTSRREIATLYRAEHGEGDPPDRLMTGWRHACLGEPLQRLMRGDTTHRFGWGTHGIALLPGE